MILPISVAEVLLSIKTVTYSPGLWFSRGKTTTLFCDVRPERNSLDRFENPSVSTSKLFPTSYFFAREERVL
jgi:hypothetical protein